MGKLQNILTSGMQKLGAIVEKVAKASSGKKSPAPKKTGLKDAEGQDFAYIAWDEKQIHALLAGSERKELFPLLPGLTGKKCLHLTPGGENYLEMMAKRGAQGTVEVDVSKSSVATQNLKAPDHLFARASVEHLPFPEDLFDFVLYPSALAWRSDVHMLIPELSRCIKDGGRAVLSMVHPFFEYLSSPRTGFKQNMGEIFEHMKKNGFFIEDLKEGSLEAALRHVSVGQKLAKDLQRYPGLPLVMTMKVLRLRKKRAA